MQDLEGLLAEHPFFLALEPEYLRLLASCASIVRFDAGGYLFREGGEADRFYVLRHGRVAIQIYGGALGAITVETLGEGEVLGYSWLIPPHRWSFDGLAVELVRAVALDGKCLRAKCEENRDLGYELFKRFSGVMAKRLEATRRRLLDVYGLRS
jgi:CRP-like cAMP-binding protein